MNAIIDQQAEFQMKQAANSNLRCGPVDRRRAQYFTKFNGFIEANRRISGINDRRTIVSKLERDMLFSS